MSNKLILITNIPSRSDLEQIVDILEYKRINVSELPDEIKGNGLTDKFNNVIVAASGSTESRASARLQRVSTQRIQPWSTHKNLFTSLPSQQLKYSLSHT